MRLITLDEKISIKGMLAKKLHGCVPPAVVITKTGTNDWKYILWFWDRCYGHHFSKWMNRPVHRSMWEKYARRLTVWTKNKERWESYHRHVKEHPNRIHTPPVRLRP
jgi:hypothetical protein